MVDDPRSSDDPKSGLPPGNEFPTDRIPRTRPGIGRPPGGEGDDYPGFDDLPSFDDNELEAARAGAVDLDTDSDFEPVAEREPSELVRRYLFPTEKFRGEWRRHPIHLAKKLTIGVVSTFLLGWLSGFLSKQGVDWGLTLVVGVWIIIMLYVLWGMIDWYFVHFVLTNKRVMLIEGIFTRSVGMMPLARVTDMKYTQSPLGRVLGYGTFEIESAGQDQALRRVENLPNPTDLYLQVVEEMYEPEASEARRKAGAGADSDDGSGT
jgi:membrane protein YdbS with pleckstrin-like domain